MTDKARKKVHAEINKNRKEDIDKLADMPIDERGGSSKKENKNRYGNILESRKEEKRLRNEKKRQIPHIGNNKHITKRAIAETEQQD
jgi:hypothetical protein